MPLDTPGGYDGLYFLFGVFLAVGYNEDISGSLKIICTMCISSLSKLVVYFSSICYEQDTKKNVHSALFYFILILLWMDKSKA